MTTDPAAPGIHDSRCPNPCPDLDLSGEHQTHTTEWPEPEHCKFCRKPVPAAPEAEAVQS